MHRASTPLTIADSQSIHLLPCSQLQPPSLASAYSMEIQLAKLIRRKIVVFGPPLLDSGTKDQKLETVTLVGVDPTGIWIESEAALNRLADRFRVKPAAPAALFIPFTQITAILASHDSEAGGETGNAFTETAA